MKSKLDSPLAIRYVMALGSAIAYGLSHTLSRKVVTEIASPLVTIAFALLFGLIFLGILSMREVARDSRPSKKGIFFIFLAGLASASGVTFMYLALSKSPVSVVSPIAATNPLIALALSHLFLQRLERITWRIALGALMVVSGVILIMVSGT